MADRKDTARGRTKSPPNQHKVNINMLKHFSLLAVVALASFTFAGCPSLQPPFDATGEFEGVFSLGAGDTQIADGCDITFVLEQDIEAVPFENAAVSGTVEMNLGCVVDAGVDKATIEELLDGLLGELLGTGPVEVSGVLLPNGTLELSTADLLAECPEGGCEKLLLIGKGVDSDDDGKMDSYNGTLGGIVQVSGQLVPLFGEFETAAAAE